jgi:CheY-like chemotaxis protein
MIVGNKSKRKSVLIADDDDECVNFAQKAIGAEYAVISAADGAEAILKARIEKPALIVLDVMMSGGMDGFTAFCNLRSDDITRDIPVIMLSEVASKTGLPFGSESMEQYLGSAPAVFLEKPISAMRLLDEIRKVLAER